MDLGVVEANFFPFLGVEPMLGPGRLSRRRDVAAGPAVMLLGHRCWVRRFGSDPGVIGRKVELGGVPHEIIGVLPAEFHLLLPGRGVPLEGRGGLAAGADRLRAAARAELFAGYTAFSRIRPGVSFAAAQEGSSGIAAQIRAGAARCTRPPTCA